jgi:sugar (pentulose or hexulose) kinase
MAGKLVEKVQPAPPGLIFLPFIDGERTPALPEASGVFSASPPEF